MVTDKIAELRADFIADFFSVFELRDGFMGLASVS